MPAISQIRLLKSNYRIKSSASDWMRSFYFLIASPTVFCEPIVHSLMQDHTAGITHRTGYQNHHNQAFFQQYCCHIGRNRGDQKQQSVPPGVICTGNLWIYNVDNHNGNCAVDQHLTCVNQQIEEVEQVSIASWQKQDRQKQYPP